MKASTPALILVALALTACDSGERDTDADVDTAPEPAPQVAQAATPSLPDTTAPALWSYLEEADYAGSWTLWPGKGTLYEGVEPHGMLLTTYLNEDAYAALTAGSGPLPAGSIIVKENYQPDSTLAAVTVMYGAEGYDPAHDDWFWAKYGPEGEVQAAGRVESCQECHSAGERGYLRTPHEPGESDGG